MLHNPCLAFPLHSTRRRHPRPRTSTPPPSSYANSAIAPPTQPPHRQHLSFRRQFLASRRVQVHGRLATLKMTRRRGFDTPNQLPRARRPIRRRDGRPRTNRNGRIKSNCKRSRLALQTDEHRHRDKVGIKAVAINDIMVRVFTSGTYSPGLTIRIKM